jgi:hypothetical protein
LKTKLAAVIHPDGGGFSLPYATLCLGLLDFYRGIATMDHKALLAPAIVLVLWTLFMLIWLAATRFPAIAKSGIDLKSAPPGGRGANLEGVLPASVNWKSHNYTHLTEQPVLFYAVIAILILTPTITPTTISLAWAYTILRIVHSLWQALVNTVPIRFTIFSIATFCLLALAIIAAMGVFA